MTKPELLDVAQLREQWRSVGDYSCFMTSPDNPRGLRLTPTVEPGRATVTLTITPDLSGFPGVAHGGISYTVLDGLMGWYILSHYHRGAFTVETKTRYRKPLMVGKTYLFEVRESPSKSNSDYHLALDGHVYEVIEGKRSHSHLLTMHATFAFATRSIARHMFKDSIFQLGESFFIDEPSINR